jgi:hypothetical protein
MGQLVGRDGKTRAMIELPKLTFPYGVVERALAIAHGVPEAVRPRGFRSMIANLQKLGVLGAQARVGRGVALSYTPTEFNRLILALEFCELGLPPATAVAIVSDAWDPKLKAIVDAAARPIGVVPEKPKGEDVILCLVGVSFRTASLRGEASPGVPNIDRCSLDKLPIELKQWMATTSNDPAPRALVVNLSARLRAFHSALADANLDDALAERAAALAGNEPLPKARKLK